MQSGLALARTHTKVKVFPTVKRKGSLPSPVRFTRPLPASSGRGVQQRADDLYRQDCLGCLCKTPNLSCTKGKKRERGKGMQGREREIETIRETGGTIGSSNQEAQVMIPFRNSWIKGHTQHHHSLSSPPPHSHPVLFPLLLHCQVPVSRQRPLAPANFCSSSLAFCRECRFHNYAAKLPDLNQHAWERALPQMTTLAT